MQTPESARTSDAEAFLESGDVFGDPAITYRRKSRDELGMLPPGEVDDASLNAQLAGLLRVLGAMRCFVEDTDHLNDRELYAWLWSEGLRDGAPDLSALPDCAWHTSPIGGCSEADIAIHLEYYAGEDERERWRERWPDEPLPPRAPLPFDRDRHSPRRENS